MSAAEAADALGVSRATLYAYVSRGLLASEPGPGPSRARRYPRAPVEALIARRERSRDGALAAHGQLHWGLPVLDSELTLIQDGRAYIRGHDLVTLSRERTFEEVATLLWTGDPGDAASLLPSAPDGAAADPPPLGGPVVAALTARLTAAGEASLATLGAGDAAALGGAARVVDGIFAAAGARGPGRLAERLARGWVCDRPREIEAALILCADHELNVS
ncbi:MAG TPA: citrate synthase, partial [Miltoncostaeaceae bacterium]|nr:citrate synthase [Miltoncostaeaceae bacterium]